MMKTYRLTFKSKRPASLKAAWQELIHARWLTNSLGALIGLFSSDSPELIKVLEFYKRDKENLGVRMVSSCQVTYDQDDLDLYAFFKLYPPGVELIHTGERALRICEECGRKIGCDRLDSLIFANDAAIPNSSIAMTIEGDLIFKEDLVTEIRKVDCLEGVQLVGMDRSPEWSIILGAPTALRVGARVGFCSTCGNAVTCEKLPEVDETYIGDLKRNFLLSPDRPSFPCFSKELVKWLIEASPGISWADFKPINFRPA